MKLTNKLASFAVSFRNDESGQDLIEYALVAALVGLGSLVALKGVSSNIGNVLTNIGDTLNNSIS